MSDLISRQAAIEALDKRFDSIPMEQTSEILMLRKDLRELPPAQPERKKGKWLEKEVIDDRKDAKIQQWQQARCSCCNKWHTTPYIYYFVNYDFCPNCGARMDGGEQESEIHSDI